MAASGITTHPLSILYYVFALNQIMPEANSGKLIGRRDIRAQIQKFWNIFSTLNFKEDSFLSFPKSF